MQLGLLDTYPAQISTIFETTDLNRYPCGDRRDKFTSSCYVIVQIPLFSGVIALKPYVSRKNSPTKGISLGCWLSPKKVASSEIMAFEPYAGHKHLTQKSLSGPTKLPGGCFTDLQQFLVF